MKSGLVRPIWGVLVIGGFLSGPAGPGGPQRFSGG